MAKRVKKIPKDLKREEVLGLDIAEHCGFHSMLDTGTWVLTESKSRNGFKKHKHFRDTLVNFIKENNIRMIAAEDVNVKTHFRAVVSLSELRGVLLEVCDEMDLPEPEFMNVSSLKLFATGNGRASKEEMVQTCTTRYNFTPVDDNNADAFHVFNFFCRKFNIK